MMQLTQITMILWFLWHFLMKKPFHFNPKISRFSKAKIVHNLKTVQLFDSIFFPGVISSPQLSITNKKPAKMLQNILNHTYHKNLYIMYIRNAKMLITRKPFNISTQFFFLGSFPPLSYLLLLPNHPKSSKKPSYKERSTLLSYPQTLVQLFRWFNSNFSGRRSIFSRSTLPKKYFGRGLGPKKQ